MALASGQWVDKEIKGHPPSPRYGHALAVAGNIAFLFGGVSTLNSPDGQPKYHNDFYILTVALTWTPVKTTGSVPSARFNHTTALLGEQIYMFGGSSAEDSYYKDIYILDTGTLAWQKCEVKGDSPSGSVSQTFTAHYDKVADHRDFNTVRNEAMEMVTRAFAIVDNAFQKLDNEKSELFQATIAFQYEKEAYNTQRQKQQQELKEMLEKHKAQNEAWLKARAEENDRERKELCKLREEVLHEQEKLKEEQSNIQKRSEQLLSIMQQFKGM
ncbi:UNVERIFIED_CONTAM: hypothetical protein FKN15_004619 [Acipenser sinensis]